jgi:hypothetical protein
MHIRMWARTRPSSQLDGAQFQVVGFEGAEVTFDAGEVLVGATVAAVSSRPAGSGVRMT